MKPIPAEIAEALRDPKTIKILTTTDENGTPHSVVKQSITVLEDGRLGYLELIYRSSTYKNVLRNHRDKKKVAICLYNPESGFSYQIKGIPSRYVVEGPMWKEFTNKLWNEMPDAEPAALWLITPEEIMDESYDVRLDEESKRMVNYRFWNVYARRR